MSEPNENTTMSNLQRHKIEMTLDFFNYSLEPISIFAELIRGYNDDRELTLQEISSVLRLLVFGAHVDAKIWCIDSGTYPRVREDYLRAIHTYWGDSTRNTESAERVNL